MGGQHLELEVDQRLQQAGLDECALAGDAAAAPAPPGCPAQAAAPASMSRDGEAEGHRALVLVAVQPHHAGARLGEQVLAGPLHPGPLVAIAADRRIDEARVDRLIAFASRGRAARSRQAGNSGSDVGPADAGSRSAARSAWSLRSTRQALLAAVDGVEDRRVAADLGVARGRAAATGRRRPAARS